MNHYKFSFKYKNASLTCNGDGVCQAKDMDEAFEEAAEGVAKDLGGDISNVAITSMRQHTPRKKKVK
jgi:hypothetical protein